MGNDIEQAPSWMVEFLQQPGLLQERFTKSCSDLLDMLLFVSVKERSRTSPEERRKKFAQNPTRSVSAPPRKRWFQKYESTSNPVLCDNITRKLVGAITTWHDIHSNLLRLSLERSSSDSSVSSHSTEYSSEDEDSKSARLPIEGLVQSSSRFSISNPELTSLQIQQMFPELSEHWR